MHRIGRSALGALVFGIAWAATAQAPIFYPSKGQTTEQQTKDVAECQAWAKQTTGIDPAAVSSAPPPSSSGGQRVRGAARGAAGGAAIGAIAGDAGKGAAIGATAGTVSGGRQARKGKEQAQQQAAQAQSDKIATYNKAVAACMEGRGYVAK
jgi:hypothetical protein